MKHCFQRKAHKNRKNLGISSERTLRTLSIRMLYKSIQNADGGGVERI